jgi:lactate dehydrogenase-like 2-hydroxyacid dehydrogenase
MTPENYHLLDRDVFRRMKRGVVLTPHLGGASEESISISREFSARKLIHYLRTGEELRRP